MRVPMGRNYREISDETDRNGLVRSRFFEPLDPLIKFLVIIAKCFIKKAGRAVECHCLLAFFPTTRAYLSVKKFVALLWKSPHFLQGERNKSWRLQIPDSPHTDP
jgi:hypothetical protein